MDILSAHWDVIMIWKLMSRTARLYSFFLLVLGGYANYSLVRVFAGLSNLRDKAAWVRVERCVANVRQIILLLLLLFGMTVANEAFTWLRAAIFLQSPCGDCVWPFGAWTVFTFIVLAALAFLHAFQWLASIRLQRRAAHLSG
jgi:hypothetical protein